MLTRRKASFKSSIFPQTEAFLSTCIILLQLVFSTVTVEVDQNSAFFNSLSSITIPNSIWDLKTTKQVTFKTCAKSGNLISMTGSLTSTSSAAPLPSSSQELAVLLDNSSVVFVWSLNGTSGTFHLGSNVNSNLGYTVALNYQSNSIVFSISRGPPSTMESIVVANRTFNSFLLGVRLSGSLVIGERFSGCMYQGPGVNFTAVGFSAKNISWNICPMNANEKCTNDTHDCYRTPCQNGATCIDGINNYTCICPHNFNGTNCENDLAELYGCTIQPCLHQGNCTDLPGSNPRKIKCTCAEGYTGARCENMIDLCSTHPCRQGTCTSGLNSYICNCTGTGYKGANCTEDIDECANVSLCAPNSCMNYPGGFACNCPPGFSGAPCQDVNDCLPSPCQNEGSCKDMVNDFNCTCAPGYTGSTCEEDVNECLSNPCTEANTKCVDGVNSYQCLCQDGFSGKPCLDIDECAQNMCVNNMSCVNTPGSYNCSCLPGFTSKNCSININECDSNPCYNNASCTDRVNYYNCTCQPGYQGKDCENEINECNNNPCKNQAECIDKVNSYFCKCQPGWTGANCEIDINECLSNPCFHNGQCHDLLNAFNCTCPLGYEGYNCINNTDDCKTQPCQNGGKCLDGLNDYICNCTSDWMGKNCTLRYDACSFKPCKNGGTCQTQQPSHDYTCTCRPGFTGTNCEVNIDDCVNNSCLEYQRCYDKIENYTCGCPIGYSGDLCNEEINECETSPCQHNGICTDGRGNYTCTCEQKHINLTLVQGSKVTFLTGYTGVNCEIDINECEYTNPPICQANGMCNNTDGGFQCFCPSGEGIMNTGTLCELVRSYCEVRLLGQDCKNGGTCVNIPFGYECICPPGFTDFHCETDIDECRSSPCQYGGTCKDRVNGYTCTCIDGISGTNCEHNIDDCNPTPCLNGGACTDLINNYVCNCSDTGFNGTNCDFNIDDCVGNPCEHGGTCVDGIKNYTCNCMAGYTGRKCEIDIPECTPNPCEYNGKCSEFSNTSLYDKDDPRFMNFTYSKAAGYICDCSPEVQGVNCSDDVDECLSDPCQNNATCSNHIRNGYTCICSKGYMGSFCETEINECKRDMPCKNRGVCVDKIGDYECTCPYSPLASQNYGGKNCTTYLRGCLGQRKCRNGDCIPKLVSESEDLHSFQCSCHPGYTGNLCTESTDISFRGNSTDYIRSQVDSSQLDLSLRFRTSVSNAILVLCILSPDVYASVALVDGRVQLKYRGQFYTLSTRSVVNDTDYHQISLSFKQSIILALPLDSCTNSDFSSTMCQTSVTFAENRTVPMFQVYIGSGIAASLSNETFPANYVGCMEDIVINGALHYPGKPIGQYFGVSPGCPRIPQCLNSACNGKGSCEDLWDSYKCQCYRPSYGDTCDKEYESATFGLYPGTFATYNDFPSCLDDCLISFFITTRQKNGFLIFLGHQLSTEKKTTFMALYIKDGRLSGDFLKCGPARKFETTREISDGQQYFISVGIKDTSFWLKVNSQLEYQDLNVPTSDSVCIQKWGFKISYISVGQIIFNFDIRSKRDVDWLEYDEYLAEISEDLPHRQKRQADQSMLNDPRLSSYINMTGFQGVIQDLRLNEVPFAFTKKSEDFAIPNSSNLTVGSNSTDPACEKNPCEHEGTCTEVFYNDYQCLCPHGFTGKKCNETDHCAYGTCPAESTCHRLPNGYECNSTASFTSDNSIASYRFNGNASTLKPVLTFEFRTRGLFGLIFLLRKGDYFIKIRVAKRSLEMNWKLSSDFSISAPTKLTKHVTEGQWFQATFAVINGTNLKLQVFLDSVLYDETDVVNLGGVDFADFLTNGNIILGSSGRERSSPGWEAGFKGCLRNVRIGGVLLPFFRDSIFQNNMAADKFLAQQLEALTHNCVGNDVCTSHPCLNGGTCVDQWNDIICKCPAGLKGVHCEENPNNCASNPCQNGGVCVDGLASFTCMCPKGTSGRLCEADLNLCSANNSELCENNSTCMDLGYDFQCNCSNTAYTGWYCNVTANQSCTADLCQNGGTCNSGTDLALPLFNCTCKSGFEGPLCEKAIDYCTHNGVMCKNNGSCTSNTEGYRCTCNPFLDFSGSNCNETINDCKNDSCHYGTCEDGVKSFSCRCDNGYTGATCDIPIDECLNKSICQHGTCSESHCNCTGSGFEGPDCTQFVNECNYTNPVCEHGGICQDTEDSYLCNCTLGYQGKNCQEPNCDSICQNGATCMTNITDWWCQCPEFVKGDICDKFGPCYYKPCESQNTVACDESSDQNYTCKCKKGWSGKNCTVDIDECVNNTVQCGNGSCRNTPGNFTCDCSQGYTGQYCDSQINECGSNPCLNNGKCIDAVNNFTCNCSGTGYEGQTCSQDINECNLNADLCNGGTCKNQPGNYSCECGDTHLGQNCEVANPCYNFTCLNGGHCITILTNGIYAKRCDCLDGYDGISCEKKLESSSSSPNIGVIIGAIVGAVVFVIIVIMIIAFIMTARSKRATRGAYSPSQQETSGSRVELGNVLKKPPEERLI